MSIHTHELSHLKMYSSNNNLFIPLNDKDNKKGSAIFLVTPNIQSSIDIINSPYIINRNWFTSYYVEKSINTILSEGNSVVGYNTIIDPINESKLKSKDRSNLPNKEFGIPSKRKFPINDEEHVRTAIKMFNHVDKEDELTLANNIIKKLDKFEITDIEVGKDNRFSKYYRIIKEMEYRGIYCKDFYKQDTIKKELDECRKVFSLHSYDYLDTNGTIYLCKAYRDEDEDECIGFIISKKTYKDRKVLDSRMYIYGRNEDECEDIASALITATKVTMMNKIGKYKYTYIHYEINGKTYDTKTLLRYDMLLKQIKKKFMLTGNDVDKNTFLLPLNDDEDDKDMILSAIKDNIGESVEINEYGIQNKDSMLFFDDIFNEETTNSSTNSAKLKKILYPERIKNQKDILQIYKLIKTNCPQIKFTKLKYSDYNGNNLYIDTSYYNNAFFSNNTFRLDKGVELYFDLLSRLVNNKEIKSNYMKTVFIPVHNWNTKDNNIIDYTKNINPISIIVRMIRTGKLSNLQSKFKDINFLFLGTKGYFKLNFSEFEKSHLTKFINNIQTIITKSAIEMDSIIKDTPDAIVTDIVDRLEKSQKINMYSLTGKAKDATESIPDKISKDEKEAVKDDIEQKKKLVVKTIKDTANSSTSTDEALEKLDNDEFIADLIKDIADEENNDIKVSTSRTSRINNLNDSFKKSSVKGKSVSELINNSELVGDKEELPVTAININSINSDQWSSLQYINFNKVYDVDEDIMNILSFFGTLTVPVAIRDVKVEDTTTSEDFIETWTVQCEDIYGNRFTLRFDIPKIRNDRFMRLRGNDKTINGQLMNLPILKTEKDVCQITSNYNKIFFRLFGTTLGKSNMVADKTIKALSKMEGKEIQIKIGSNHLGSLKYELPLDYTDFGTVYNTIKYKGITFYFNQDEIRDKYKDQIDLKLGIPVGYDSGNHTVIYYNSSKGMYSELIRDYLIECSEFKKHYEDIKPSVRYSYAKASIMTTEIPVIVITSYCEGLTKSLTKANIKYTISESRSYNKISQDIIKFKDAYIIYDINYSSSVIMNGLKECPTEDYTIKDINSKAMWTDFLDIFGGRIKADGLDNFYDLMFDPITKRTCEAYDIPEDFCSALIYASNLLIDSKFNRHVDITGNRYRTNEIIAGYTYKELARSYADYRNKLKKTGKGVMTIKQSSIIDAILADNTCSDSSAINDLCYAESANTVSFKGLSGMNSERSYSLDKRTYDNSMNSILAMSTGFASTVGETRQTTINMNIKGKRGYIKNTSDNKDIMNDVNTLSVSEAITPLSTTHDDPFREAMSFIQRTKHDMRVRGADPLLITNGTDDALSNFTPDYFSVNAKQDGKIVERDSEHIIIKYKDGSIEFVDLTNNVFKNSDGGFYTSIKLKASDKLGTTVKQGQLIAYDPLSYSCNFGYDDNPTYNQGTIAKIAIMTTDEGFEDSTIVDQYLCKALSSNIITNVDINLDKNTNVYNLVKVGQPIEEGEDLLVIQNSFEDEDINILLKNLVDDEEQVTALGRIPIKSKNTGVIEAIKIYRTVEIDELSDSLKKIVKDYEKEQDKKKKMIEKYDASKAKEFTNNYKLDTTGKLKNVDGVLIEIYVNYKDDFSVGDKLIVLGAQKGVAKETIDENFEPVSEYRPEEPINCMVSMRSFDARMITAPLLYTLAYKGVIELDRQVKDIMGIKQKYTIMHDDID